MRLRESGSQKEDRERPAGKSLRRNGYHALVASRALREIREQVETEGILRSKTNNDRTDISERTLTRSRDRTPTITCRSGCQRASIGHRAAPDDEIVRRIERALPDEPEPDGREPT